MLGQLVLHMTIQFDLHMTIQLDLHMIEQGRPTRDQARSVRTWMAKVGPYMDD